MKVDIAEFQCHIKIEQGLGFVRVFDFKRYNLKITI
jgi:hypothetical protein